MDVAEFAFFRRSSRFKFSDLAASIVGKELVLVNSWLLTERKFDVSQSLSRDERDDGEALADILWAGILERRRKRRLVYRSFGFWRDILRRDADWARNRKRLGEGGSGEEEGGRGVEGRGGGGGKDGRITVEYSGEMVGAALTERKLSVGTGSGGGVGGAGCCLIDVSEAQEEREDEEEKELSRDVVLSGGLGF
ncbi:hypothetical protein WMY93_032638 [Mugilogobius chulae]|uniref:Uncharacterized protein n=1 Tax=Mugilogobius chulae TaxID=88201 RepID=A0AAW0MJ62_9GOBI